MTTLLKRLWSRLWASWAGFGEDEHQEDGIDRSPHAD